MIDSLLSGLGEFGPVQAAVLLQLALERIQTDLEKLDSLRARHGINSKFDLRSIASLPADLEQLIDAIDDARHQFLRPSQMVICQRKWRRLENAAKDRFRRWRWVRRWFSEPGP